MLRSLIVCAVLSIFAPNGVQAQVVQPQISELSVTLHIEALLDVMRAEGMENGAKLADDMFAGQGKAAWTAALTTIYDQQRLQVAFDAALDAAVAEDAGTRAAITDFFGSALGQKIIGLEVSARRTLLDDAATTTAAKAWTTALAAKTPRSQQIERFSRANDLIESNVMGALNANLAFYRGMSAEGGFGDPMPQDQMIQQVWAQEADIRTQTADWLFPFLMLAYQPLTDAELQTYIDFSETAVGKSVNAAIFAAFDAVFTQVSQDLGQAAARQMVAQEI